MNFSLMNTWLVTLYLPDSTLYPLGNNIVDIGNVGNMKAGPWDHVDRLEWKNIFIPVGSIMIAERFCQAYPYGIRTDNIQFAYHQEKHYRQATCILSNTNEWEWQEIEALE